MNHALRFFAASVVVWLAAFCCTPAKAAPPTYLMLMGPAHDAGHPHAAPSYGYRQAVSATPYAYGWFGAHPRRHFSRHFGYYRNFTQWKAQ